MEGTWDDTKDVMENAAPRYTMATILKDERAVGFARDKLVTFIGSSHDRNNVEQWCYDVSGRYESWGGHAGGLCHLEWLNLTVANWFLYGMVDNESYDWFRAGDGRPITFEQRIEKIMVPEMKRRGHSGVPDLVVMSSLFWDEDLLWSHAWRLELSSKKHPEYGFTYREIQWHRSRFHELINLVRGMWGQDVPLMFRTRQHRLYNHDGGVLKIFQFDQSCRALAKEVGVRLFTWGGKMEGWTRYYDGDQHFPEGPSTYIFGDMMMFYLYRAINPGCWDCHQWDD